MAIKESVTPKRTVKKTSVKKTATLDSAVINAEPVDSAVKNTAPVKSAAKKAVRKKAVREKTISKQSAVVANPVSDKLSALKVELAALKVELKAAKKREAGLARFTDKMSVVIAKSVSLMVKSEFADLNIAPSPKPRKKRVKAAKRVKTA